MLKATTSFACIVSLIGLLPAANALVGSSWSMTNVPSGGLTDITFPLTIVEADHISGYYFAQQFAFVGNSEVGYTGLQPRPDDANDTPILHGVFSSFIAGAASTDPNCFPGADGGAGVSCSTEWNGVYGRTYDMEVRYDACAGLWVGTAIDTVTGERYHIGSYTLPEGTGGIKDGQAGFVEWYPWNVVEPADHCAHLPYQQTIFGPPRTTNQGSVGSQSLAFEYGDCVGQVGFFTGPVDGGADTACGWLGETGA
ncbi:hypothetical protein DFH08DRAFT_757158 [Mycena albidolilacea]|uniref:Uncharacterized protein n=1 Tax=Mycena albidolilacea TaxID=1033008 RepID=A0AAD6Z6S4_9AGAR|nr:hypothetical protein DFH08DRAFT_757158 [Mycena albidolilacea]